MVALLILIPLIGIIILNMLPRETAKRTAFWFAMAIFMAQIFIALSQHTLFSGREAVEFYLVHGTALAIDSLGVIMLLSIGIVALPSLIVGQCMLSDRNELFRFINLLIITTIGMTGIIIVRDIFTLYVFLEITAVASFVLIAFRKDINGLEGAFKYLMLSAIATVLILTSIALILISSCGTSFAAIHEALAQSGSNPLIVFAIVIFICGLLIKGGLVPFHGWLPDAYMAAPAPVSILLGGIVTKAAGIYTLIRMAASVFIFDERIRTMLMLLGTISILAGAFAALGQKNFKRMLAYSSISQIGYIVLGFGTGTALGIAGAVFHLFNHAIFKSLLFVNAAAVEKQVGTNDMQKMGGLSSRMPVTGATSVIGMLSTSGIPPFAGFWSKLIIIIALWQSAYYSYAAIAIMASVVTLAYFLYMQRTVFFGELAVGLENIKEANFGFVLTSSILAAITIGVGLFFPIIFNIFFMPVKEILVK
ncbi:MAG: proton-conducting transporter membrane subunit [Candidatus Omnitrophota bacterium]